MTADDRERPKVCGWCVLPIAPDEPLAQIPGSRIGSFVPAHIECAEEARDSEPMGRDDE